VTRCAAHVSSVSVQVVEPDRRPEALAVDVLDLVAGDRDQPCAQRRLPLKGPEPLERHEKDVLDHVVHEIRV
jgi:hypothetical protein